MKSVALILILLLTGCGYSHTELPNRGENGGLGGGDPSKATLDFAAVKAEVFDPHCVRCHSARSNRGLMSFETYAQVKPLAATILHSVLSGDMPPAGPLPENTVKLLTAWVNAGAPENAGDVTVPPEPVPRRPEPVPQPTPEPTPAPLPPDFATIKAKIIDVSCIGCHSGEKPKGDVSLETFKSVQPIAKLLLNVVKSGDMPPRGGPLSPEMQELLESWVNAGAPEFIVPIAPNEVGFFFDSDFNAFESVLELKHTVEGYL